MANSSTGDRFTTSSEGGLTPALLIAAGAVLPVLGIISVALRFYSRLQRKDVRLGVDDWLILCSIFFTTGLGVMLIVGAAMHFLAQPTEIPPGPTGYLTFASNELMLTEKVFYAFNITQCLSFGTAKLSVLFFYRRIFRGQIFDVASITMIVIVCIWTVGFTFAIIFRCGTNVAAQWLPLKYILADCYASTPMFQTFSISDVVTDLLIILIPIYWVNRLQLPLTKKMAISGIFLLGFIAIAAGIARLVFFIQQSNNYAENQDGIGHLTTEMYWSMIEMGLSVVAACLPTIRPLLGLSAAESVIRSIRSRLTLRSNNSSKFLGGSMSNEQNAPTARDFYENVELADRPRKQSVHTRSSGTGSVE